MKETSSKKGLLKNSLFPCFLVCLLTFLFTCRPKEESPSASQLPQQSIHNFSFMQTEGLDKLSEIKVSLAEIFKNKVCLETITIKFYEQKKVVSILKADKGEISAGLNEMAAADIIVSGRVLLSAPAKGIELQLDHLRWKAKEKKFVSAGSVKEITKEAIITGNGLEATADLSKVVIKDIKGHTRLEGAVCNAE